jgi:23S rRNA (uracil1939-C5)-methyltransferase
VKQRVIETVHLDKIVPGGQALGVLPDGRKVFVWGALPGETARVELTKTKKSYAEGIAVEILESSPHRIRPRDECYMSTSPWQIMDYDYELAMKAELVAEAFRQEHVDLPHCSVIASTAKQSTVTDSGLPRRSAPRNNTTTDDNQFGYRNKMEYSLWWDNETDLISLAFHKRGTHQKVPIHQSSIERPEIFAEAQRIVAELNIKKDQARKYQSLLVRCNQGGEVSSALLENGKPHPTMKNLTDEIMGHKYSYSPNGFFQINLPVYEMALAEIKKHIATDKVVDMYSGVGTIGLSVARDRDLTLVETDNSAFAELENNVTSLRAQRSNPNDNRLPRRFALRNDVTAIHAKSEEALDYITPDATITVDPPRAGLHDDVIQKLVQVLPPKIIYLSCNPATQARDIAKLLGHGSCDSAQDDTAKYKITHAQPFNFFPRTPHIENLVVLEKKLTIPKRLC